jgi:hypothetical protein
MHLTKMMLSSDTNKRPEKPKTPYVGNYIQTKGLSGFKDETPEETKVRLAMEQAYSFEKALHDAKAERENIFSLTDNDFELIPMYDAETSGDQTKQKFVYKDQTISTAGYLTTLATNCVTSYALASQFLDQTTQDEDSGKQTDWVEDIVFSGAGFIASYLLGSVLTAGANFFEKKIEGIVSLPVTNEIIKKTKDAEGVEHIEVREGAPEKIIRAVEETETFKKADLSTTKIINSAIAIANGAALAYHGYQRNSNESQGKRTALAIGWGIGGLYGFTNLGYAFAQGYGKSTPYNFAEASSDDDGTVLETSTTSFRLLPSA